MKKKTSRSGSSFVQCPEELFSQLEQSAKTREAFKFMEAEQQAEYEEYVKMCGGTPISQIKPS